MRVQEPPGTDIQRLLDDVSRTNILNVDASAHAAHQNWPSATRVIRNGEVLLVCDFKSLLK